MRNLYAQLLLYRFLNLEQTRVAVFKHLSRLQINEMVVLLELERTLVGGAVMAELVLYHEVAVDEQNHCVIECCTTDLITVCFHPVIQCVDVEMTVCVIYLSQYGVAFGRLPKVLFYQIIGKNLLHRDEVRILELFHFNLSYQPQRY